MSFVFKKLFPILLLLGGIFWAGVHFLKKPLVISEQIPYGLPLGTEIAKGKDFKEILAWQNESSTIKERFDRLFLKIRKDPSAFEDLSKLLIENPNVEIFQIHALLFALEHNEDSHFRSEFIKNQIQTIEDLYNKYDNQPIPLYLKALFEHQKGLLHSSKSLVSKAVNLSPHMGKAYTLLSQLHFQNCAYDSALHSLPYAINLDAEQREKNYALLLKVLLQLKDQELLESVIQFLEEKYPYSKEIQLTLARVYEAQDKMSLAEETYETLHSFFPKDLKIQQLKDHLGKHSPPSCSSPEDSPLSLMYETSEILNSLIARKNNNPYLYLALWKEYEKKSPEKAKEVLGLLKKKFPHFNEAPDVEEEAENATITLSATDLPDSLSDKITQQISSKNQKEAKLPKLGQYLIRWNEPKHSFYSKYGKETFTEKDSFLVQTDQTEKVDHTFWIGFQKDQYSRVISLHEDSTKSIDVLGKVLRLKVGLSGNPQTSGEMKCPGFLPFQFFIWEDGDTFEMFAQFNKRTHQVRGIRLEKLKDHHREICDLLEEILPPEL